MPIKYNELSFRELLGNQAAYEIIDITGKSYFENWDIREFERNCLGLGEIKYIKSKNDEMLIRNALEKLNDSMPLLEFDEPGFHSAYELFIPISEEFCSRGDPFFWSYVSRQFTYDKLPMSEDAFTCKYMTIVNIFNVPYGENDSVYIKQFAAGGISSGLVHGFFCKEMHEMLLDRLNKYK